MDKVLGVPLDRVWGSMEIQDRFSVAKDIAKYQQAWMSSSFELYGSLYYAQDLDVPSQSPLHIDYHSNTIAKPKFAIGPSTGREFNDDGRATVEFDKGPCKNCARLFRHVQLI